MRYVIVTATSDIQINGCVGHPCIEVIIIIVNPTFIGISIETKTSTVCDRFSQAICLAFVGSVNVVVVNSGGTIYISVVDFLECSAIFCNTA